MLKQCLALSPINNEVKYLEQRALRYQLNYLDYLLEKQTYFIEPQLILVTPIGMGQLEMYEMSYCVLALGDKILLPMSMIGRENLEYWQNHRGKIATVSRNSS